MNAGAGLRGDPVVLDEIDRAFMDVALRLGRRNAGRTWPNPAVGAVLVQGLPDAPRVVGRGWTDIGGRPHAEVRALESAGAAARGATCYVSLEPCSHTGRTPPCTDALVAAGVARVVTAMADPNPLVSGRGHRALAEAGIAVRTDVLRERAERAHAGHLSRMAEGRPHVVLKQAVSADGCIGRAGDGQLAISCALSRRFAHLMRAESDAILVGVGTVLEDDPQLTCRLPGLEDRSPVRIVVDSVLRTPPVARLFADAPTVPVWIVTTAAADLRSAGALHEAGAEILTVAALPDGEVDLAAAMRLLGGRGLTTVMVEGGSRIAAALFDADLVDEAVIVRSPVRVGDGGTPALAGVPLEDRLAPPRFRRIETRRLGEDTAMRLVRTRPPAKG